MIVRPRLLILTSSSLTDLVFLGAYNAGFHRKMINLGIPLTPGTINLKRTDKAVEVLDYLRMQASEEGLQATFCFVDQVPKTKVCRPSLTARRIDLRYKRELPNRIPHRSSSTRHVLLPVTREFEPLSQQLLCRSLIRCLVYAPSGTQTMLLRYLSPAGGMCIEYVRVSSFIKLAWPVVWLLFFAGTVATLWHSQSHPRSGSAS